MKSDFSNRHQKYEDCYDQSIPNRLPILIRCDGRGFSKVTKNIEKPFCYKFSACMTYTMHEVIKQIDSAILGYTQSDEISFVLWNHGDNPWFDNRIQKISTVISSMVTGYFNSALNSDEAPSIKTPVFFDTRVWALPNATEIINYLILRQQNCRSNAISTAAITEFTKKYGKQAQKMLLSKKNQDKIQMLQDEFGIDYNSYPSNFRNGTATYKAPKIISTPNGDVTRTKWIIDVDPPIFSKDRMFLIQLLSTGSDIFRANRDLND